MKRRHGAVIYVPERERQLLARLTRLSDGLLPPAAVAALYREVLSSSRAAQGQKPIGVLRASASLVLPASRACFGACDRFSPQRTWAELAKGLETDMLSLALMTADDLAGALRKPAPRGEFLSRLTVAGDFPGMENSDTTPERRIFIVTPQEGAAAVAGDRVLILIECKSTVNAIKSLLRSMPISTKAVQSIHRAVPGRKGAGVALVQLTLARAVDRTVAAGGILDAAQAAGLSASVLGVYPVSEVYGG